MSRPVLLSALALVILTAVAGGPRAVLASGAFFALFVPLFVWTVAEHLVLPETEPAKYHGKTGTRLLQASVFAVLVVAAVDHYRLMAGPLPQTWGVWLTGSAVASVGGVLRVAAIRSLRGHFRYELRVEDGQSLVTTGLYGRLRHPSYSAILLIAVGMALALGSVVGLGAVAVTTLPLVVVRIRDEEGVLLDAFGPAYAAYRERSWRLVPFVY